MDVQVRIGNSNNDGGTTSQIALSCDSGASWSPAYDAVLGVSGAAVTISADADTILWRDAGTSTVKYSRCTGAFTASIGVPTGAAIASDKKVKSLR
jgi:xyloglucan-specific exo-beta-1,4-glucanase